jgi:cytochrome b
MSSPEGRLPPAGQVQVWDRFVRSFHWGLVASFGTAWWFTEHIGWLHKGAGYAALALVAARVVWGFVGSPHARFANFVPGPRRLGAYLAALAHGREPRHLGHNPAGAVMILFLLVAVAGIGVSGWMLTLDAFWGNETVETVHTGLVDLSLWAVGVHVIANIVGGLRHHENLVLAMLTGHKPQAPQPAGQVPAAASDSPSNKLPV